MYRNDWHAAHRDKTQRSAEVVARLLLEAFPIGSVLDVGCGHGDWLKAFAGLGVADVMGCDGPWTDRNALLIPPERFIEQDFRKPFSLGRSFDLVVSTEVGEHFEERYAEDFVRSMAGHADLVFFGAAAPYQGGYRHVNEQWPSWWADIFTRQGFEAFDLVRPAIWNEPGIHFWYKQNPLVYVRSSRTDLVGLARAMRDRVSPSLRLDVIHPEKYEDLASYRSIAFKPLARHLPGAVAAKIRSMLSNNRPS